MTADVPIVVIGLMGAGKTSVSRLLSKALGRPMRDSDEYLEERYGATAAEIAAGEGAEVLHAREAAHLLDSLAERPAPVIAAAASVLDDPRCRTELKPALVVWLDATPEFLAEKIMARSHRPRFGKEPLELASELHERRAASFTEVADLRFQRPEMSKHEVARAVLDHLEATGAGGLIFRADTRLPAPNPPGPTWTRPDPPRDRQRRKQRRWRGIKRSK